MIVIITIIVIVFAIQLLPSARRNSFPPPPTYPLTGYDETKFSDPYTDKDRATTNSHEDIHESRTSNGHTTFVSHEVSPPTQDTSTTNGSTDNVNIVIHTIIIIALLLLLLLVFYSN